MTNEEKKAWLGRYRLAGLEVQRLTEEIARWETQATTLTARYGGSPGGGTEDPLQRSVEKILELRDELARQLQRQLTLRQEIEEAIAGVEDERLRELLRLRYLHGWTWERVAERLKCSQQWAHRLHIDATQHIRRHI